MSSEERNLSTQRGIWRPLVLLLVLTGLAGLIGYFIVVKSGLSAREAERALDLYLMPVCWFLIATVAFYRAFRFPVGAWSRAIHLWWSLMVVWFVLSMPSPRRGVIHSIGEWNCVGPDFGLYLWCLSYPLQGTADGLSPLSALLGSTLSGLAVFFSTWLGLRWRLRVIASSDTPAGLP